MYQILIVCVGNVCRSPMAEILFRRDLPRDGGIRVSSAGLAARVGDGVHPTARRVMDSRGLPADEHRARQVDRDMLARADLVLAMERRHLQALLALSPRLHGRLHLLGRWDELREVRDPCGKQQHHFEAALDDIQQCARSWCDRIARAQG